MSKPVSQTKVKKITKIVLIKYYIISARSDNKIIKKWAIIQSNSSNLQITSFNLSNLYACD